MASTHPQTGDVVLSAQGLVKRFGGITATGNVTLNLVRARATHSLAPMVRAKPQPFA